MIGLGRNARGDRVIRFSAGQAGSGGQLINVMLVVVIASAIGFIGTDVNAEIDASTDVGALNGEDITVRNETTDTIVFNSNDRFFYTVSDASRGGTFDDDEAALNNTDAQLTEATDYEWFTGNATFRFDNTSAIDNNTRANVTYNYTELNNDFSDAKNNLSGGYSAAMSLTDIVFLMLMFGVILSVLLVFRRR